MLYSLTGQIVAKQDGFLVVAAGSFGFKIHTTARTRAAHQAGEKVFFFCHLQVREDGWDLYGFPDAATLAFFEQLIAVSGVGPKSALAILDIADLNNLTAAIQENRPDLLTRAAGVGRKTAERIIVELRGRVKTDAAAATVKKMESDADLAETLISLGYRREAARLALAKVGTGVEDLQARLKAALKILSGQIR